MVIPITALQSHRPRSATVFDPVGDILLDRAVPVVKGQSLLINVSGEARRLAIPTTPPKGTPNAAIGVGDLAVLTTEKSPKLRVVSSVTGQQVSLIDFGDEDGEIEFLRDRVIKLAS